MRTPRCPCCPAFPGDKTLRLTCHGRLQSPVAAGKRGTLIQYDKADEGDEQPSNLTLTSSFLSTFKPAFCYYELVDQ
jgi:hypothetical protein